MQHSSCSDRQRPWRNLRSERSGASSSKPDWALEMALDEYGDEYVYGHDKLRDGSSASDTWKGNTSCVAQDSVADDDWRSHTSRAYLKLSWC
jgi:hypothetical protein